MHAYLEPFYKELFEVHQEKTDLTVQSNLSIAATEKTTNYTILRRVPA